MSTLHEILELLGASLHTPHGLLHALAASKDSDDLQATLAELGLDAESIEALAQAIPSTLAVTLPPAASADPDERSAWLDEIGRVHAACQGLSRIIAETRWASTLHRELSETLDQRMETVRSVDWGWRYARDASERGGLPWEALEPSVPVEPSTEIVEFWAAGMLHPDDEAALRKRADRPGTWRDAYRAWLVKQVARLDVQHPRSPFDRVGLDAAFVPLPHMGHEACMRVSTAPAGVCFHWPGQDELWLDWRRDSITLPGDAVTGQLRGFVDISELDDLDSAEAILDQVASLDERRESDVIAAAEALGSDAFARPLASLAANFVGGTEHGDPEWARVALELRIALDRLADRLLSPALFDAIERADQALEPLGDALLMLADETWDMVRDTEELDRTAWWGRWAALDEQVPDRTLAEALSELAPGNQATAAPFAARIAAAIGRFWSSLGAEIEGLTPWVQGPAVAQAAPTEEPALGRAPVLAVVDGNEEALVFDLAIRLDSGPGDPWESAPQLKGGSRDAARRAFAGLADLTTNGLPLAPFDHHRFSLRPFDASLAIDGPSLALSVALALASLWTRRPLSPDLFATAGHAGRSDLARVGHLEEKAALLSGLATEAGGRLHLLLAADQDAGEPPPGVDFTPVANWEAALQASGLGEDLAALCPDPLGLDRWERRDALETLIKQVGEQRHTTGHVGSDVWRARADQLCLLIRSLQDEPGIGKTLLDKGRSLAALASSYAGDVDGTSVILSEVDDDDLLPGGPRLLRLVTRLSHKIVAEHWEEGAQLADQLEQETEEVDPESFARMGGMVAGTRGRFWLHNPADRRLDLALRLLRQGVAHHAEHDPRELPRSRTYLSLGLRVAGQLDAALLEIDQALSDLSTLLAGSSYGASTSLFAHYERARVLLDLERPGEAREAARRAIEQMNRMGWRGLPGPYRTLAWACRGLGDLAGAAAAVTKLEGIAQGSASGPTRRILDEARGEHRLDGEIF